MKQRKPLGWFGREIASLNPGSFALVMATGIISNSFFFEGRRGISDVLFAINAVAFAWLALITLVRFLRFGPALWADLIDPGRVFGFFTMVAGSDVFGSGLSLRGLPGPALALWIAALVLWLVLTYLSFCVLTFRNGADGADIVAGGWLNAIVGTQSLVILGTVVAPLAGEFAETIFVLIHALWGIGLALYGIFIALFVARIFYRGVSPDDLTPMLWVVMGAAAISTNAGSTLILTDSGVAFLTSMRSFIDGVTLVIWAWATWWIPLLVIFGIWKHGVHRVPLGYTPLLWSMVFPLGMYSLATARLSLAADFSALHTGARGMMWIALAVWIATALALIVATWRSVLAGSSRAAATS
ncbi:MAG: tellurite resistance/C4-dicarboxylate transporter family protein [Xanthobacteraceae bacterium]|nr:tellurite resistance/C4-dicarboxylate transporter family protein [Xanthobacteraceae bacterium]